MDDVDELEALAHHLQEDGQVHMPPDNYGFSDRFAWAEDRFGVNWQLNVKSAAEQCTRSRRWDVSHGWQQADFRQCTPHRVKEPGQEAVSEVNGGGQ